MKYLKNAADLQYNGELCTGCRLCVEVCPHGVFVMQNRKAAITDSDLCMECGACQLNCESGAIHVRSGVGCASALIHSMITGGEPVCGCSTGSTASGCC